MEARRLVKNMRRYLTDSLRSHPEAVAAFERILAAAPFPFSPLNEMLWTGLLTRFIPQLSAIRHRIQYDRYHLHPVDKHSLKVVRTLKLFGGPEDPSHGRLCGELYEALPDRRPLLWAALLHDIGKGEVGGDHAKKGAVIAAEIMRNKGYDEPMIETVCFLIREHLLLAKTATRRDIHDEETALFCARKVQEPARLQMLYLLTVADSIATGPKAWNGWSLSLMQGLYFYSLRVLEQGELASKEAVERVEAKKAALLRLAATPEEREAVRRLTPVMSPRYLLHAEPADMMTHVNLHRLMNGNAFAWKIEKNPDTGPAPRTVTICAKDHPGLFYKISGVFTLNNIDILNAQVFTWRNNAALDIFHVTPPPDLIFEVEHWETANRRLQEVLEGRLDLCAEVKERIRERRSPRSALHHRPTKVVIDNRSSSYFTIIEVFAYDFTGLLFLITEALFRLKLDVWLAKIATQVDQVVDVFYVRNFEGEKVDDPAEEETIRRTIIGAID
jgi:[protein-PII] uridylyltransferase